MGFSPLRKGATAPPFKFTFQDDDGDPISLIGVTTQDFVLTFYNLDTQIETNGNGTWTILNAQLGQAQYALAQDGSDTSVIGRFEVRVAITTPEGLYKPDVQILVIRG